MEANRYHHSASSTPSVLGYFETPSSLLAFLVVASKLGKFKLLCSLGWASVEAKEFNVGTVVSLLAKNPHTMLDQNSHRMRLLIVGMSNQKSKFHASSHFGNRLLASCQPASCQGKSSYQAGRCWQLELARPILQEQKWRARAAVRGLTLQHGGWRYSCPTLHCSLNACVFVLLGMQLKWMPLNSFLAEIL